MLEFIQGELVTKGLNYLVVQAGGLGYRLQVSANTLGAMPAINSQVTVYTHLYIREDELSLYGFHNEEEKELFGILLSVSGIGPKLALAVLSKYNSADFKRAIILGDTAMLVSIPGVGKKTAERMVLELKDKVGKLETEAGLRITENPAAADLRSQAVTALMALGYSLAEAQKAVPVSDNVPGETVEDLLKTGLKNLARF